MKVLWLCSWYPHTNDPYDGDFIERQARAYSLYQPVNIIHIVQSRQLNSRQPKPAETKTTGRLSSKVFYVQLPNTGIKYLDLLLYNRRYLQVASRAIEAYIHANGNPDLVHVHVPVKAGALALRLKKRPGIPFVVTEHSSAYFKHIEDNYFERSRYFRYVTKQCFENAELVTSVSNWLLNRLGELFRLKRVQLIRNTVDMDLFFPAPVSNTVPHFIHVSMMWPLKNVNGILHALSRLNRLSSNWQMSFVGPANEEYRQLAAELGLQNQVHWKGAMNYAGVASAMQQADALVHFSKYENLPCVVNEALCCGLPVITSNVGGIAELVNESNGILVENENIENLAAAMLSYLRQPDRFHKQNISKAAIDAFGYQTIGKQLLNLYNEVLKRS
jgi:glycosyltransferase involved in cell wall biosynthesis